VVLTRYATRVFVERNVFESVVEKSGVKKWDSWEKDDETS
jgi:hypothetical protein